jgi:hypothetical protein
MGLSLSKLASSLRFALLAVVSITASADPAHAWGREGFRGGGLRVAASTTYRPGRGVTSSRTVTAGRYHTAATLPAYSAGVGYRGAAIRTIRSVARQTARRTAYYAATGYSYYYGEPAVALPVTSSCIQVIWEGTTAYNCGGYMYLYANGYYYPIDGT